MIVASSVAILFALTYGGARYPLSSWRIIVPLVLGLVGLVVFALYESLPSVKEPVMPPRLFKNRTSAAVIAITFFNSVLLFWAMYFLPVYFQAVQTSSPRRSGVQLLPFVLVAVPGAIVAVIVLTKFGRYRPLHHVGLAITTMGLGLFTLSTPTPQQRNGSSSRSSRASAQEWCSTPASRHARLPYRRAIRPPQPQHGPSSTASAASGASSSGAIFNSRSSALASTVTDLTAQASLTSGRAYEHATSAFVDSFSGNLRERIIGLYTESLQTVWQVAIAFCGLAFLLVFLEREVPLRKELDTEYGLEEQNRKERKLKSGGEKEEDARTEPVAASNQGHIV